MNTKLTFENIIKITLSILLFGCLLKWKYGYYQLVRILGMLGFSLLAYKSNKSENTTLTLIWICAAILLNPFIKLALGRTIWNLVDVLLSIILILSIFIKIEIK